MIGPFLLNREVSVVGPLVFVHIPKTAGTSFRKGLDTVLEKGQLCRDYGPNSAETSAVVRQWVYESADLWRFGKAFRESEYQFLVGHFHASRYVALFGAECMFTFLRDPLQRVVSEYEHYVRNYGYGESLETFYRQKPNINRQQRLLSGFPWLGLGFIGITERYGESVDQFNRKFNLNIPVRSENRGRASLDEPYRLTEAQEKELRALNAGDIQLYRAACDQLDWRIRTADTRQGYVAGALQREERGRLLGWARAERGDDPVLVRFSVDGKPFAEAEAFEYRPHLNEKGIGRGGFLGFSVDVSDLPCGARVECTVAETGQPLPGSPWVLQKK